MFKPGLREAISDTDNSVDEGRKTKDYQNMITVRSCVSSMMPPQRVVLYPPLVGNMGREAFWEARQGCEQLENKCGEGLSQLWVYCY